MKYYAHSKNERGERQELVEHLRQVAEMARRFASEFGAGEVAYWIGLWHDLGKFDPDFQRYLLASEAGHSHSKVPHAIWGAALIYHLVWGLKQDPEGWKEFSLPIAGHHAGLDDAGMVASKFEGFLQEQQHKLQDMIQRIKQLGPNKLPMPSTTVRSTRRELFIRMVFSALVDADHLDTERHFNPAQAERRGGWPTIESLWCRLEDDQRRLIDSTANGPSGRLTVNRVRREVYEECVRKALGPQGVYRLRVPTGGGKTRSGLAFALKHAQVHDLRRVIVAIPYTSIIDQTARTYRNILGEDNVVEHHSQVMVPDDEAQDLRLVRSRLATENWDAPVVVTTNVQLFESLMGNHPAKVRKLHNLVRSVIVLDEVQTLPTHLLEPTLDVLRVLVEDYKVTVVLSTATQPAFEDLDHLKPFQELPIIEIVDDFPAHFRDLRRVEYELWQQPVSWADLARKLGDEKQAMVILNRRRDALELVNALRELQVSDVFHLSTLLCGAHRRKVLEQIQDRLKAGQPVRLISTQVVEAGVDLDFPTVWRAIGPLDRIVQAAGRCNREGRSEKGRVVIFEPAEGGQPQGPYATATIEARRLLKLNSVERLHDPELHREYFTRLLRVLPTDAKGLMELRRDLRYRGVAQEYKLIEEDTVPVVVDYGEGLLRLDDFRRQPSKQAWQRLQPYLVSLYRKDAQRYIGGLLEELSDLPGLYRWWGEYDDLVGLVEALLDPSDLIA